MDLPIVSRDDGALVFLIVTNSTRALRVRHLRQSRCSPSCVLLSNFVHDTSAYVFSVICVPDHYFVVVSRCNYHVVI